MTAVVESFDVIDFNITREPQLFTNENIGGLYLDEENPQTEISQSILQELLDSSEDYNPPSLYSEFLTEDILIEESFKELTDAKEFVQETFSKFKISNHESKVDILDKLTFFYSFFKLSKVNCRFEVLSGDSCKKFHCDNVKARMICTYAGPGTQIKKPDEDDFMTLPSGSTLIVKGTQFQDFRPVTLHRSPPIETANAKRFLFIADFQ